MTETLLTPWWGSWCAGGQPQPAAPAAGESAAPASVPAATPATPGPQPQPPLPAQQPGSLAAPSPAVPHGSLIPVGGARAQSRFSGKTAIPLGTCAPLSSSGTPPAKQQQQQQGNQPWQAVGAAAAAAAAAEPARHAAWAGAGVGHTLDGSAPSAAGDSLVGEHASRWVFDTLRWRWVLKGEAETGEGQGQGQPSASDKHQLAARRWGDGRDALGAAALHPSQQPAPAAGAAAASAAAGAGRQAARAAPAKRPRLQVTALTGDSSDEGFASVGGLAGAKESLLQHVAWPLVHPRLFSQLGVPGARGVLLHGPPGSGKTHLARALAAEARLSLVCLNGGECAGEDAEKRMRRAFNTAKAQAPCILLLDELDAMAPSRCQARSEHERQATSRLLAALDELRASRARVGVVGATNRREAVDAALRRAGRLDMEVPLGALSQQDRLVVLRCCTRRMPLHPAVDLEATAGRLRGYVGADVAAVASEAGLLCAVQAVQAADAEGRLARVQDDAFLDGLRVTAAHFEAAAERLGPAVLRGLAPEVPETLFDEVGGLEEAKAALRELVELPLTHGPLMQAYGLPPPRGALLYGPPGCGKTLLARAAASRCGANFLSVRGPELLQMWLGESEAAVRRVFEAARQAAPCLIFFDEIDSIACRRGSGSSSTAGDAAGARVLNQLLVELDGISDRGGVFVLCATNRPEALDPALMRPGRLDHLLHVPLPDEAARLSILRSSLRRCPLAADVSLEALAGSPTDGLSGADLAEVCRRAGMAAVRELVAAEEAWLQRQSRNGASTSSPPQAAPLQQRHLEAALAGMGPSVSQQESRRHHLIHRQLTDGSLPAPESGASEQRRRRQEQAALLQRAVQEAVQGMGQGAEAGEGATRMAALQLRVRQLEDFVRQAGLQPPPAPVVRPAGEGDAPGSSSSG